MKKIFVLLAVIFLSLILSFTELKTLFTLESIQENYHTIRNFYLNNKLSVMFLFSLIYIISAALALPFALMLTILSGAIFGLTLGIIIASFSSTIGATICFLISRYIAKDFIQNKYKKQLLKFNEGFKKEGAFYLFAIRLTPIFPFFIVNIVMGLLQITTIKFYFISQIAMLPATLLYVYAGVQISTLKSISDITSPELLILLFLIGIFPILSKKLIDRYRNNQ